MLAKVRIAAAYDASAQQGTPSAYVLLRESPISASLEWGAKQGQTGNLGILSSNPMLRSLRSVDFQLSLGAMVSTDSP